MAGGRPTKYKEKYAEMLIDFFDGGSVDFENLNGREPVVGRFPTLARFALNIGTHTASIKYNTNKCQKALQGHKQ